MRNKYILKYPSGQKENTGLFAKRVLVTYTKNNHDINSSFDPFSTPLGKLMTPLLSFVGKSGCGKTTLIEKLVVELRRRGYSIAVVKHHAHTSPIDDSGKDSWRFAEAGANLVVVSSPVEVARFERVTRELTLAEIVARIEDVDLILTEGFKREAAPKIEISRQVQGTDLVARTEDLVAVVSDHSIDINVPRFDLNDVTGIVDFIENRFIA